MGFPQPDFDDAGDLPLSVSLNSLISDPMEPRPN